MVGRDDQLKISGEDTPVAYAAKVIQGLIGLSARGRASMSRMSVTSSSW